MPNIDHAIHACLEELEALRKTREDHWQIPWEEGELLHNIALSAGAKLIVEVGTSYGFSGLWWSSALKHTGGHLHTIDMSQKKFDSSRQTFSRAGLATTVTNHLGDARQVLARIPGPIDIAFIDADKPATLAYFEMLWPKISPGGSVLTDNASTHVAELADFTKHVRSRPDASSTLINLAHGLEWTIKLPKWIRITVRLFAIVRDLAGTPEMPLDLPEGASVEDAVAALKQSLPRTAANLDRCAFAVNREYAPPATILHDGDELAIIPPVSGG